MCEELESQLASSFRNMHITRSVLAIWRANGPKAAQEKLDFYRGNIHFFEKDLLQQELELRLGGQVGPRLLVDGLWFSRPPGGITRVWEQILRAWQLPGLIYPKAPICLIDRDSQLLGASFFPREKGRSVDPLDAKAVEDLANENAHIAVNWGAQAFISSWISSCGNNEPTCPEVALVHDCLPERFQVKHPFGSLRSRWLRGAKAHLAVSQATAKDLETFADIPYEEIYWCHSAPAECFAQTVVDPDALMAWKKLCERAAISQPYVLLPATSSIGSYKNPEVVAKALGAPELGNINLILCGVGAAERIKELENHFPHLIGRTLSAGFTDQELALVYQNSLAVVIPSRIEGFGLPAIEALAARAVVLVADSPGLREAGGKACMRFASDQPKELVQLLQLLLDPLSRSFIDPVLERRRQDRLKGVNPDLIGLCLLALARKLAA